MERVLSSDKGIGLRVGVSATLSSDGSKSLIVKHVVQRKTFSPCGHRTVASQVIHLPVMGSGFTCFDVPGLGSGAGFCSSPVLSLLAWLAALFFSVFLEPKNEDIGWLKDRVCACEGDGSFSGTGFRRRVGIS
jgi:hypothetical protein